MANIDYLIVAGGGAGGHGGGGGGGGGGYQYLAGQSITSGTYSVVVGAGGVGTSSNDTRGTNGGNSSFNGTTATGGGAGGAYGVSQAPGQNGGSGGGGGWGAGSSPTGGTGSQGSNGGAGIGSDSSGAGGGGGSGGAGSSAGGATQGGNGGVGTSNSITGSAVTYASGGGGSCFSVTTQGTASAGGGASATWATTPANATANTGGGGGGVANDASTVGGNGGSGVVIVRILTADWFSITGGTQTIDGAYTVCTFTSSGDLVLALYDNTYSLTTSSLNAKRTENNFTAYGAAAVTFMAWVKTTTDNANAFVMDINDGSNSTLQLIKVDGNYQFQVDTTSPSASALIPETSVETGSWVHLAGTYDGANIKIFLNGVQYGSNVAKTGNIRTGSPTRLGIGVRSTGADLPFVGEIDDVKVFNIALSEATIASYMSNCSFSRATSGLTGWWTLDNTNADSQINITANNLVSVGSPSFTTDPAYSCSVPPAGNSNMLMH